MTLSKSNAQPSDSIPINKTQYTSDIKTDSLYRLNFDKFPTNQEIINFTATMDDIVINTHRFETFQKLLNHVNGYTDLNHCAYYNPTQDKIFINFIEMQDGNLMKKTGASPGTTSLYEMVSQQEQANKLINDFNNAVPGMLQHELWHQRNFRNVSLYGLDFNQIIEIQLHDEFSAVIAELLFRRNIFLKTKSANDAFAGTGPGSILSGHFKKYEKFLKNSQDSIISTTEADLLIETSVKFFMNSAHRYAKDIPNLTAFKMVDVHRGYCGADTIRHPEFHSFENEVRKMYTFDDWCILDYCSDKSKAYLQSNIKKFLNKKDFKRSVSRSLFAYQATINEHALNFRNNQK